MIRDESSPVLLPDHRGFLQQSHFIDHWVCELRLEAMRPLDLGSYYPICLGGKRAAPPEDGGGVGPTCSGSTSAISP